MKRSMKIIGVGLVVVVVGVFAGAKVLKAPKPVAAPEAKRSDVVEAAYGVGTVKSDMNYTLKTGVSSRVIKRYVTQGEHVKKGQALIQLDGLPLYRAPFDGVVSSLSYNEGELIFAQTAVLSMVSLEHLYMQLSMDERTISGIRQGQEARISFEGQRKTTLIGSVRAVYSSEGEFLIDINFDPKDLTLLPGMTADVAIQIAVHKNQILNSVSSNQTPGN